MSWFNSRKRKGRKESVAYQLHKTQTVKRVLQTVCPPPLLHCINRVANNVDVTFFINDDDDAARVLSTPSQFNWTSSNVSSDNIIDRWTQPNPLILLSASLFPLICNKSTQGLFISRVVEYRTGKGCPPLLLHAIILFYCGALFYMIYAHTRVNYRYLH